MTKRDAKRRACAIAAQLLQRYLCSEGEPFEGMSTEDAGKVEMALDELTQALWNRSDLDTESTP